MRYASFSLTLFATTCLLVAPIASAQERATAGSAGSKTWRGLTHERVSAEALAIVAQWATAQSANDYAKYAAFYDPEHFRGVKRTSDGTVKRYDGEAWLKDRKTMFSKHLRVMAEDVWAESWLQPKSKLKRGITAVHFTQRWKSKSYADHGDKVIHLWRAPDGTQRIIYEDMLNSRPGWDLEDAKRIATKKHEADKGSATLDLDDPLSADLGLTIGNYLAVVDDLSEAEAKALALAVLLDGRFECEAVVEYDECGESYSEWDSMDPAAGVDDPCLKRLLALWAFEEKVLSERDLLRVIERVEGIFELPEPEDELPEAVLFAISEFGDDTRVRLLTAAAERYPEYVDLELAGLGDASLRTLYEKTGMTAVLFELDAEQHLDLYIRELETGIEPEAAGRVIAAIEGIEGRKEVHDALVYAVEHSGPGVAAAAAIALEGRGDRSKLPRFRPDASLDQTMFALQMLAAEDSERARQELQRFLAPEVVIGEELDFGYYDPEDPDAGREKSEEVLRAKDVTFDDLFDITRDTASCSASDTAGSCIVDWGSDTSTYTLQKTDAGWKVTEAHLEGWRGCDC